MTFTIATCATWAFGFDPAFVYTSFNFCIVAIDALRLFFMNTFGIEAFTSTIFVDVADSVTCCAIHWFDGVVDFMVICAIVEHFADAEITGAFFGEAFGMIIVDFDAYFAFGSAVGCRRRCFIARFEAFIEIICFTVAICASSSAGIGMVVFLANLCF